ncbi:MAG: hypothetical protein SOZ62_00940 [Eubacteriales bacterium]|nr:hypothetical protein [Eubacteriales bacterium]
MIKRIICLAMLLTMLLTSSTMLLSCGSDEEVVSLSSWYVNQDDKKKEYNLFIGFLNKDDKYISTEVDVDIKIVNIKQEEVYTTTKHLTKDDFGEHKEKNENNNRTVLLAKIIIPYSDIAPGKSNYGAFELTVHKDKENSFDEIKCSISSLPIKETVLNIEGLPLEFEIPNNYYGTSENKKSVFRITEIKCDPSFSSINASVTVSKVSGENADYYPLKTIGYKVFDNSGNLMNEGSFYVENLKEITVGGSKDFEAYLSVNKEIVPGETYTLRIFEE